MLTVAGLALLGTAAILGGGISLAAAADGQHEATRAIVSGDRIQKVGFRAMVQKEAIMYNLAGSARNNQDGTVTVSLQGDKDRIDQVVAAMRTGSKKSSTNNKVSQTPDALNPGLTTFTVFDWTSTSRNITNPYDLVFHLRPADDQISHHEAKEIWNKIAEDTLKDGDLDKFRAHLNDDDE